MKVYELRLKVYLLKAISAFEAQQQVSQLLDQCLGSEEQWKRFHESSQLKGYSYGSLYPTEKDKVYKKGKLYTITVRTINAELASYFADELPHMESIFMKGLEIEISEVGRGFIESVYSVTPMIVKFEDCAYWRDNHSFEELQSHIRNNSFKKYSEFGEKELDEKNTAIWNQIKLINRKVIATPYKNIKMLGDKIEIKFATDYGSQEIAHMLLATGIGELNSRGFGFLTYHRMRG